MVHRPVNTGGPIVGLRLESRPQTLTIVRGMLSGVAELLEVDPELLDDLKTAVSEACNNVVLHAYGEGSGPMEIRVFADAEAMRVSVADEGSGLPEPLTAESSPGIGVSVIRALSREVSFTARAGGGTEVLMSFDAVRDGRRLYLVPEVAAARELPFEELADGEIGVTLSPVSLLTGVLGRLARTLAATAHFSLDRFSDVYLVTDTLAAHAESSAAGERILARLSAGERRLDLALGPFRRGTGVALTTGDGGRACSPLTLLADEISVREWGEDEGVDVVVVDHRR
jgi:serine/threonine-protein kinase RsbW